ncbi:glycosyltransferase [Iodobacter sp. HSC-16F04]|uniref:Glycosyltransferase n=1 Tax=Iodobacter violaceini TaxID=3044271 RepID=A0ABX0KTD5_9NEIS|nr:glycosyltransferase [Iodobacter violacea]NHQ85978.1 glycosyltransferase [Iodobacter violacea]
MFPTNSGYKQSVLGRIYEAKLEGHEVFVIGLSNESAVDEQNSLPYFIENDSVVDLRNTYARSWFFELSNLISLKPRYASLFGVKQFKQKVSAIIDEFNPEEIIAESLWAIEAVPSASLSKTTLVSHDVVSEFLSEMQGTTKDWKRKFLFWLDRCKLPFYEKKIFNQRIKGYLFLTIEDMNWYRGRFELDKVNVTSNHLFVNPVIRNVNFEVPFLLFPGSVEFSQNKQALTWYVEQVLPLLCEAGTSPLKVIVTGKVSSKNEQFFSGYQNISFSNEISRDELDQLYASCLCVLSPIISGTGIKIKILEATQRGIPVVATKMSSKGIFSENCFVADDNTPEQFAKVLYACISKQYMHEVQ